MNIVQHLDWVSAALGAVPDCIIVNSDPIPEGIVASYTERGATPLYLDRHQREIIQGMGCLCIEAPTALVTTNQAGERVLRHDPQKLAAIVFRFCRHLGASDPVTEGE